MQNRKRFTLIVVFVVISMALVACGGAPPNNNVSDQQNDPPPDPDPTEPESAAADPAPTAVVVDGSLSASIHFDPAVAALDDADSLLASDLVYDTLVQMDGGTVTEGLANRWSVSDDGLTYEFRLRANAVFTDGTQISTGIVADNFNRWFDPEHALHGSSDNYHAWMEYFFGFRDEVDADDNPMSIFDGFEKVDDLRFLMHLNEPVENFYEIIAMPHFSILNPAVLAAEGADYGTKAGSVVGSGPYAVADWTDTSLTLDPNGGHWGTVPADTLMYDLE